MRVSLALTAALLASLFLPWDGASRSSFALLAATTRSGFLPASIPATPLLMWWVLQPVLLLAAIVLRLWRRNTAALAAIPTLCSSLTITPIAWAATLVPNAAPGATVALVLGVLNLAVLLLSPLARALRR